MSVHDLIDKSFLAELRRIEIRTRRSIDSELVGNYCTAFRGSGLVFSDLREYQPGDDIKHIHWKVTARTGKPYIKTFDEDRTLNIMLAVDISRSTAAGGEKTRHRKALEFSALMAMLGNKGRDSVGLCLFSDEVEEYFAPQKTRSQFQRIISALLEHRTLKPATDLGSALKFLEQHLKKRSVVFLVSDFFSPPFDEELRRLSFRHDLIGVMLKDSERAELPDAGIVEFIDAESGQRLLFDTGSIKSRSAAAKIDRDRINSVRELFKIADADLIEISDNLLSPLAELMRKRTRRR